MLHRAGALPHATGEASSRQVVLSRLIGEAEALAGGIPHDAQQRARHSHLQQKADWLGQNSRSLNRLGRALPWTGTGCDREWLVQSAMCSTRERAPHTLRGTTCTITCFKGAATCFKGQREHRHPSKGLSMQRHLLQGKSECSATSSTTCPMVGQIAACFTLLPAVWGLALWQQQEKCAGPRRR